VTSEAELQPLADENMKGLAAYNFYTSAGEPGQQDLVFHAMPDPRLDYANQQTTLRFTIGLDHPYRIQKRLEIGIDDPEYYVAITFDGPQSIRLENAPPGCHAILNPPKPIPVDLANQLAAIGANVVKIPPKLEAAMRGMQGSIDVSCDYAVTGPKQNPTAEGVTADNATTAVDAVNAMGATDAIGTGKPIPFGGPPRELTSFLPIGGLFLWILNQQQRFYELLTGTMAQMKSNGAAFWVLGSLSFLYGIFHAAGPGHGKVVISSYVLANEQQYRKGMLLSFAAAMMASTVAVVFILFAASVLRLTGMVMGNLADWLDDGSYAMVSLLGLWLMIRHIFGLGHHHHHDDEPPSARDDHADRRRARELLYAGDEEDDALAGHRHGAPEQARIHAHEETPVSANILARAFETSAASARGAAIPAYAYAEAGPRYDHGGLDHHDHDRHGDNHHGGGHHHDGHHHDHEPEHTHVAVVPSQLKTGNWREALGVVFAVGLRPCSGALVVLVFALSQGVLWAGIASVFLMGIGTAITVATLATIAMFAKGAARRLSGRRHTIAMRIVWWGELFGAFFVFAFGILLILANLYG
jgi:nickel/cobalt transporter (NicO) family protein